MLVMLDGEPLAEVYYNHREVAPVVWGIRIQPFALVRVVRGD